jgi:glutamate 5-kinase
MSASVLVRPMLTEVHRLVVKIGSALLVEDGHLRADWLEGLAQDVADLRRGGMDVILVSSGSIALGRGLLGLGTGALTLEQSQAAAAVGQISLAQAYAAALVPHGITAAQVLVTLEDTADRRRYLNARATLATLLGLGALPIVNENDTVATDEIRYGDNDRLAAQIAALTGADGCVLLSDVDGFYSGNPKSDPDARRFEVIDAITPEIEAMAGDAGSGLSKGGMKTKVMAARTATQAGCALAIADGRVMRPLSALAAGANSTWFLPQTDPQSARKHWIAAMKPKGRIVVDAGAARALGQGKSLLPAGITAVEGRFGRGEPVTIAGSDGALGIGLSRYTSDEARLIAGHHSDDIEGLLGYAGRAVVIHRDDMVL